MFDRFPLHRRPLAFAAASLVALGVAAGPAQAESFEQVSRYTGAQGASPLLQFSGPVFTSDSGRWAIFSSVSVAGPVNTSPGFYVRDIVANTTRAFGDAKLVQIYGVDRAEQQALVKRYDAAANQTTLALLPIAGGAAKVLRSWSGQRQIDAALSGDGKVVAVSSGDDPQIPGLFKLTVATGAVTQISSSRIELGARSISDDGSVIAGRHYASSTAVGAYFRGTTKTDTPAVPVVSPNGATVAGVARETAGGPLKVVSRTLSTGVTRWSAPLPDSVGDIAWISADGKYLASSASRETQPHTASRILDIAAGTWTDLTGPYATTFQSAIAGQGFAGAGNLISRNGRFGVTEWGVIARGQLALVDLQGADLPGTQEPLAASAYVNVFRAQRSCPSEPNSSLRVVFAASQSWIPEPQEATIRVLADGVEIYDETIETPGTPEEPWNGAREVPFPTSTQTITYDVSVVDAAGLTQTASASTNVFDAQWCS